MLDYWWVSFLILAQGDGVWRGDGDRDHHPPPSSLVPGSRNMIRHLRPAAGTWKVDGGLLFGLHEKTGPAVGASTIPPHPPPLPPSQLPAEGLLGMAVCAALVRHCRRRRRVRPFLPLLCPLNPQPATERELNPLNSRAEPAQLVI